MTRRVHGEIGSFGQWPVARQIQILYGVGGERRLPEQIVPWLPGYENSAPVRIGNGAYQQLQLDVFGEIVDAMPALKAGMEPTERSRTLRPMMAYLADGLARARRRHLGGERRAAAFRAFEGDGVGGLRSCGE